MHIGKILGKTGTPVKTTALVVCSVAWLVLCFLPLLPQIRSIVIEFVQSQIAHKQINYSFWDHRLVNMGFAGFCFYAFIVFLYVLERLFINRGNDEKINWEPLFIFVITVLALLIRFSGFNHKTGDYLLQSEWVKHLRENGYFLGFKTTSSNYNAIYLYLCGILSYLPVSWELYLMKMFSCVFDFICALFSMKIIHQITANRKIALLTYPVIIFSPTIVLNSGVWAQCDSMYAAFLLISLFFIMKGKPDKSMIFFGIGLSFKLQAIFMFPMLILVFVANKWSFRNLFYAIFAFFAVSVPAWIFGWPIYKWFINYFTGIITYGTNLLTMNAPTIYSWGITGGGIAFIPVIFITAMLVLLGFLMINRKAAMSHNTLLLLFLLCNFAIPFFLPNMHERYFYVGEIAVLLFSLVNPKRFYLSFLVIMPAISTYFGYLCGVHLFTLTHLSVVMLIGIILVTKWLIESILADQKAVKTALKYSRYT
jgi:Gpi18-like mannosyltransferase